MTAAPAQHRVPHNIEAEQALLGAILMNNDALDRVVEFLEPRHFFDPLHARIFDTAAKIIRAGRQATPVTLKTYFENEEPLGSLTVPQYLGRLAANATTIINAKDYGHTVREMWIRRQMILTAEDLIEVAYNPPVDTSPDEQIERFERNLYALRPGHAGGRFLEFARALDDAVDQAADAYANRQEGKPALAGLSTGFPDLDEQIGGLRPATFTVLGGGTGMGKSTLALNIAYNVARAGTPVSFLPREMTGQQVSRKILSAVSGIPTACMERGTFDEHEFDLIRDAQRRLRGLPITFDNAPAIEDFLPGTRRLVREKGVGFVIVDYLGLMEATSARGQYERTTVISNKLKQATLALGIPVLALCQLNRKYWERADGRPMIADLRDAGAIEQDADVVMFVHREEKILQQKTPAFGSGDYQEWRSKMDACKGVVEVLFGKHRYEDPSPVRMRFDGEHSLFQQAA
jgi:replicative DNA helicase